MEVAAEGVGAQVVSEGRKSALVSEGSRRIQDLARRSTRSRRELCSKRGERGALRHRVSECAVAVCR